MSESTWPAPTPRDEMLARVVTRGRRIQMVNRILIGLAVAGVVTAGAVGVALGTSGAIDLFDDGAAPATVEAGAVEYRSCPDGAVLGRLRGGDRVFLTGRDESGAWMEVRSPVDQVERVWVRADVVDPDATVDLPVAGCDGEELTATGPGVVVTTSTTSTTVEGEEPAPEETTTTTAAPGPTPTQPPGPGPTTPTTQPPPPPPAPVIGTIGRSNTTIWERWADGSNYSCSQPSSSTISVQVSGATSATVSWNIGPQPRSSVMTRQGDYFFGQLGPFAETTLSAPPSSTSITVTVTASGPGGSAQRSTTVTLNDCDFG